MSRLCNFTGMTSLIRTRDPDGRSIVGRQASVLNRPERAGPLPLPAPKHGRHADYVTALGPRLRGSVGRRTDHRWRFDLSIAIRRQPADVFAFLADIQDAEPIPRRAAVKMVKKPSGPTAVGTRWHERVRMAPALWLHIESVVTEIAQPSRLGMDFHSHWFAGHLTYEIQAEAGGSVLCQHETLQPRGPVRWLERFIEPYLRRQLVRRLRDIQLLLERGTTPESAHGPGQVGKAPA